MKQYLMRFLRRHWGALLMLVVVAVLVPLVGAPLLVNSENRRLIEEAQTGDSLFKQIQVGDLYRQRSYAIEVDHEEAVRWYRRAAEGGHPLGQMRLAEAYTSGAGVPKDTKMAFRLYMEAANRGWYDAMIKLSVLYEYGLGVEADLIEAYRWVWLAYASGSVELRDEMPFKAVVRSNPKGSAALYRITELVFRNMPEDQKEEVIRRAKAWEPVKDR